MNARRPAASAASRTTPRRRGPLVAAVATGLVGAALLTVIMGIFASTAGTLFVSGVAGALVGLLVAGAVPRSQATRVALTIAGGTLVVTGVAVWILARAEGGVMDPITYLWTTFGFGIPAQALVAIVAAAWGAGSGPIRWRS